MCTSLSDRSDNAQDPVHTKSITPQTKYATSSRQEHAATMSCAAT